MEDPAVYEDIGVELGEVPAVYEQLGVGEREKEKAGPRSRHRILVAVLAGLGVVWLGLGFVGGYYAQIHVGECKLEN